MQNTTRVVEKLQRDQHLKEEAVKLEKQHLEKIQQTTSQIQAANRDIEVCFNCTSWSDNRQHT